MRATIVCVGALALTGLVSPTFGEFMINFETTASGDSIPGGATLTDQYEDLGVMFSSTDTLGPQLVSYDLNGQSGVNAMQGGHGYDGKFALIDIDFSMAIVEASLLALDVGEAGLILKAWDANNNLVDSDQVIHDGAGFGNVDTLEVSGEGIVLLELRRMNTMFELSDGYFIDDLRFSTPVPAPGAAVLLGLAGLAGRGRRRR